MKSERTSPINNSDRRRPVPDARLGAMNDEFAKEYLHNDLSEARATMLWKLEGLTEYDTRLPLTRTGTNLLGLIKHLATTEAWYFGEVFGRPFPGPLPRWDKPIDDDHDHCSDMWATEREPLTEIIDGYRNVWEHSDATIASLAIDAPGHVPWWPRPDVLLFNILVHVLSETNRHLGHADILREQLDGTTGFDPESTAPSELGVAFWENRCTQIEQAARASFVHDRD